MRREGDTELTDRRTTDNGSHSLQGSPLWTSSSFALRPGLKAKVIEDTGKLVQTHVRVDVVSPPRPPLTVVVMPPHTFRVPSDARSGR